MLLTVTLHSRKQCLDLSQYLLFIYIYYCNLQLASRIICVSPKTFFRIYPSLGLLLLKLLRFCLPVCSVVFLHFFFFFFIDSFAVYLSALKILLFLFSDFIFATENNVSLIAVLFSLLRCKIFSLFLILLRTLMFQYNIPEGRYLIYILGIYWS